MNNNIKYLIEELYQSFNPMTINDTEDNPKSMLHRDIVNKSLNIHYPKNKQELRKLVTNYLENGKTDFNDIDVSGIDDFSFVFMGLDPGDIDLSDWNVSNGKNFFGMFAECHNFNSDLSNWNVSNGISFECMFKNCMYFSSDLSGWNVNNGLAFKDMFKGCEGNIKFNFVKKLQIDTHPQVFHPNNTDELMDIMYYLWRCGRTNFNCIDTSRITSMRFLFSDVNMYMWSPKEHDTFKDAVIKGLNIDISGWDVSNVTDFHDMFGCNAKSKINPDISNWDVSSATNFDSMLRNCNRFNCDLSQWNVSSVTDFGGMFTGCSKFNSDLSNWDVSSGIRFLDMFDGCKKFNSDLSRWNVSNGENMRFMFSGCESFNSDLSNWKFTNASLVVRMFQGCKSFNCDVSQWHFPKTTSLLALFAGCESLQSDVSGWDVSGKKDLKSLFEDCINFQSDLSGWDVSSCEDFSKMFKNCHVFQSDLSGWKVDSNARFLEMFNNAYMFDSDLSNWKINPAKSKNMFTGARSLSVIPQWYKKKWKINENRNYITESINPADEPIIQFLKMVSKNAYGFQKKLYTDMLNDAQSVDVVPVDEVFDEDTIDKIVNRIQPEMKGCYQNAYRLCDRIFDPRYIIKYCVGYMNYHGIPIEHAWNSVNGKYIDITKEFALQKPLDEDTYVLLAEYDVHTMRDLAAQTGTYDGLYMQQKKNEYKK